jgi:hypothetical protein
MRTSRSPLPPSGARRQVPIPRQKLRRTTGAAQRQPRAWPTCQRPACRPRQRAVMLPPARARLHAVLEHVPEVQTHNQTGAAQPARFNLLTSHLQISRAPGNQRTASR